MIKNIDDYKATNNDGIKPLGVLSDTEIKRRLNEDLIIHPLLHSTSQITGCKVDLHLSGVFHEIKRSTVDAYDPATNDSKLDSRREIILPLGSYIVLHPGDLILASTFENVKIPINLLGILQGRSSLGRLGIIVHATASYIDPGFNGTITLELSNLGHLPVRLYTLARVASLAFFEIVGKVQAPYKTEVPSPLQDAPENIITGRFGSAKSEASQHDMDWEYEVIRRVKAKQEGYSNG
jgi:dCTP deaminase